MFTPAHSVLFLCSITLAYIVKGLAGFGDALVSTPLLSLYLPTSTITPGLLPVSILLNGKIVWKNRAHFSFRAIRPISTFVLMGIIPGTLLLRFGSPVKLKLLLGVVIVGLGIEMLTRRPGPPGAPNPVIRSVVSFCSGITAGLFGIDMLFVAYLERVSPAREEFRANMCFVFILENLFRGALYLAGGMFTGESLFLSLLTFPAALAGIWLGGLLDRRISNRASRRFVNYVFILGGVSTVIYSLIQII